MGRGLRYVIGKSKDSNMWDVWMKGYCVGGGIGGDCDGWFWGGEYGCERDSDGVEWYVGGGWRLVWGIMV